MTKAENSRVAQSNEPSADRIAAGLCKACGEPICDCPDHVWASRTVVVDTRSDAGSYAAHIRDTACMGAML